MKKLFVLACVLVGSAHPAFSTSSDAPSPHGTYALKSADCGNDKFVSFSPDHIDFATYSCSKLSYDQTQNGGGKIIYQVKAKSCQGEEDTKPHDDHFKLVLEGESLQVFWADGSKSAKAVLCKK